jgi:two-component system, cell cycle response regulator
MRVATPTSDDAPRAVHTAVRALTGVAVASLALFAVQTISHVGGSGATAFFENWVYNGVVLFSALACVARAVLVRSERAAWLCLGLGLTAWTAGEIHYSVVLEGMADPPYPSLSDAFWLLFYPASYVGLVLLVRSRVATFRASLWLDGLVAALGAATIGAATLFRPVLHSTAGTFLTAATDLAYPLGDLTLLGVMVGALALTGWRPGRAWLLIAASFGAIAATDGTFLYLVAHGVDTDGTAFDVLWPAATLLLALAAWQRSRPIQILVEGWLILVLPTVFGLGALGVLVAARFGSMPAVAIALATATLLAVIVRMAMTFGENLRMIAASRQEALTDALTGLGNRRRLMRDLSDALTQVNESEPRVLIAFDLDGFKGYNDAFGHPAGDALLARLGRNLELMIGTMGHAYRLGGDEFSALVKAGPMQAQHVAAAASAALADRGGGFDVTSSYGLVLLPQEAADPELALQIADQRLYSHKGSRRSGSVGHQARDLLLQVLAESQPDLRAHLREVADLVGAVAVRLGMRPEEIDETTRAAELHDLGKMAIPESILQKPGGLEQTEWDLMRQHTIIGERILRAAPAMIGVSRIVRSSHENWDGSGYPDGLTGRQIPLGSRVVMVCDAYHAMTSARPYRQAVSHEEAVAELLRWAGRQFDPLVVDALRVEVTERGWLKAGPTASRPLRLGERAVEPAAGFS